jgi:hypothetical protein
MNASQNIVSSMASGELRKPNSTPIPKPSITLRPRTMPSGGHTKRTTVRAAIRQPLTAASPLGAIQPMLTPPSTV